MAPPSTKSAVVPKAKVKPSRARAAKAAAPTRPSAEIRRVADLLKQVSDPTRFRS